MHELCYIPSVFHNSPRHTFFLSNISASLLFPDITHEFSYVPLKNHSPFFITSILKYISPLLKIKSFCLYLLLRLNPSFSNKSRSLTISPRLTLTVSILPVSLWLCLFSLSHSSCLYSPCLTLAVSILPVSLWLSLFSLSRSGCLYSPCLTLAVSILLGLAAIWSGIAP